MEVRGSVARARALSAIHESMNNLHLIAIYDAQLQLTWRDGRPNCWALNSNYESIVK